MSLLDDRAAEAEGDFDSDSFSWIGLDPNEACIELDREIVRRFGMRGFLEVAWPIIEPGVTFVSNWHIDCLCWELEQVSAGRHLRLAIAMPPRHAKSIICSVMWPAWDWIAHPTRRWLFASYSLGLATRDSLKMRRIVDSPWYRARWGDSFFIAKDQNTKTKYENSKTGAREIISIGSTTTGLGGDIIVCDDPNNVISAESAATRETTLTWWNEAMPSRLNDQRTGAFVVIQQRVNAEDVIGDILRRQPERYRYVCLPARFDPNHPYIYDRDPRTQAGEPLWPAKFDGPILDDLAQRLGAFAAAAQLQQLPAPREGGLFKQAWFHYVDASELPTDLRCGRGYDLAATEKTTIKADPDYTATVKIGISSSTGLVYILHAARWREAIHETKRRMRELAQADGLGCEIELPQDPGAAGKALAQDLVGLLNAFSVRALPVTGDKMARASPVAGQMGAGRVKILKGDWNGEFEAELTGFPTGAHDDWVDALSSAYARIVNTSTGLIDYYERLLTASQNREM